MGRFFLASFRGNLGVNLPASGRIGYLKITLRKLIETTLHLQESKVQIGSYENVVDKLKDTG
jgi:hypothetical protein